MNKEDVEDLGFKLIRDYNDNCILFEKGDIRLALFKDRIGIVRLQKLLKTGNLDMGNFNIKNKSDLKMLIKLINE